MTATDLVALTESTEYSHSPGRTEKVTVGTD